MNLKQYLKSNIRGEFTWNYDEVLDEEKIIDVICESTKLEDRYATIVKHDKNNYEVGVLLLHSPFEVVKYRKSRNTACNLAEKLIRKDIEKSTILAVCDLELLARES